VPIQRQCLLGIGRAVGRGCLFVLGVPFATRLFPLVVRGDWSRSWCPPPGGGGMAGLSHRCRHHARRSFVRVGSCWQPVIFRRVHSFLYLLYFPPYRPPPPPLLWLGEVRVYAVPTCRGLLAVAERERASVPS